MMNKIHHTWHVYVFFPNYLSRDNIPPKVATSKLYLKFSNIPVENSKVLFFYKSEKTHKLKVLCIINIVNFVSTVEIITSTKLVSLSSLLSA